MEGFFSALAGVIGEGLEAGWIVVLFGAVFLLWMVQTGRLLTVGQHKQQIDVITKATDSRVELIEKHFVEINAAHSTAWKNTLELQRDTFTARLAERDELLNEAQQNISAMLALHETTAEGLDAATHTARTTERLLASLSQALGLPAVANDDG